MMFPCLLSAIEGKRGRMGPRPPGRSRCKSRFTILGGKKAICAGVVPTTPQSLERAQREMSHILIVLYRPGYFCSFSLLGCVVCWLLSSSIVLQS